MSLSLFSTKPEESGFRLLYYEVYNWGTFDKHVWKIEPEGETTLLTGANASGKTTLIDGLLTLLVPEKRMRFYNQTAGSKGERTEDSYVTGEFGETENETTQAREVNRLRSDRNEAHSILLAVFQNENHFVTLAQCRWFAGNELKRSFVIAHAKLSISQDFAPFDFKGEWKKKLKSRYPRQGSKDMVFFPDGPGEYGRHMRKIMGMRSEKAHTLFSQTIGLKVLGNLDEFVRTQMLEERDAESEFQKVKAYFKTLYDAHKAIEKAHEQIRLLNPIRDKSISINTLQADELLMKQWQEMLPFWFATRSDHLLTQAIAKEEKDSALLKSQRKTLEEKETDLNYRERQLEVEIIQDETGRQLAAMEHKITELDALKKERDTDLKFYNTLAIALELQESPSDEDAFLHQADVAMQRKTEIEVQQAKKHADEIQEQIRNQKLKARQADLDSELQTLRSQKNNITGRVAEIRNEILKFTGATEKEIPFIGELITVRPEAHAWEPAIEKLLHNFALRLIVPDTYYKKVNAYVNANDLKGRIVYHQFKKGNTLASMLQAEPDSVYHKLDLRQDSPYLDWVEYEIKKHYDYHCTDDLETFRLSDRAITSKGLIRNGSKHEKDDRPGMRDRHTFVLGWDNKEKIAACREQVQALELDIRDSERRIENLKKQKDKFTVENEKLIQFTSIAQFKRIDIWSLSKEIQTLKDRISELQKSNNRIQTLKKQRDEILAEIKTLRESMDIFREKMLSADNRANVHRLKLRQSKEVLDHYTHTDAAQKMDAFRQIFIGETLPGLDKIERLQGEVRREIENQLYKIRESIRQVKSETERLMREFRHPVDPEITKRFEDWNADTHLLPEDADFLEKYVELLNRIEGQELADYKQKFKKYLNEEMITRMSDFKGWLDAQEEDILNHVDTLNRSLSRINFKSNPPTFIKLTVDKDYAPRVKAFRFRINDWKPNIAEYQRTQDDKILEDSFVKIRSLLDELTDDENLRKEVLDVRNWLKFKAVEHHKEDPTKVFRSYTGTAKLSGGEGAQLTYTILGSAIAYQFGIHSEGLNTDSFRFICVDEAFSKQDDEKARFLMELCRQLHLQLMVVSPAKAEEVAIVEPYISKVHFVQRQNNRNSVVYDMSIQQLQEKRIEFLEKG